MACKERLQQRNFIKKDERMHSTQVFRHIVTYRLLHTFKKRFRDLKMDRAFDYFDSHTFFCTNVLVFMLYMFLCVWWCSDVRKALYWFYRFYGVMVLSINRAWKLARSLLFFVVDLNYQCNYCRDELYCTRFFIIKKRWSMYYTEKNFKIGL